MAIQFGLLKQGLPNFSGESLIQSALTQRGQNMSALQNALQLQGQANNRVAQQALASRAQEQEQLNQAQQARQFNADLSLRNRLANQQAKGQRDNLLEQQRQFDTTVELGREKEEQARLFAQAYASGNRSLMYSLDPEKAQKLESGDRKTIMDMQKAQTDMQRKDVETEQQLRKEFLGQTKDYADIQNNYAGIQDLKDQLNDPSIERKAEAQTAIIYKVAKMLDPGGRVTDGDFNTIANNNNLPSWLKTMATKAKEEKIMTPEQEARLLRVAEGQFKQAQKGFNRQRDIYGNLAKDAGLNPERVAIDFTNPGTIGSEETARANLKALQARRAELMKKAQQ